MKKVAVVIPVYKTDFKDDELISLKHLDRFLGKYDKFFVVPNKLDSKKLNKKKFKIVRFPFEHFKSVRSFSELTISKKFYLPFNSYEYILIYHLDSLVFSDQLMKWCNEEYDYIGSPLFNSLIGKLTLKKGLPPSGGNGGFSLRKVASCIKVLEICESLATRSSGNPNIRKLRFFLAIIFNKSHKIWLNAPAENYPFNEDGFWSFEAPKYFPEFKIAPFKKALEFSFEQFPQKCFELNKYKLPFGCHAWNKYDKDFWNSYLLT